MLRFLICVLLPILLVSCDEDSPLPQPPPTTNQVSAIGIVTGLDLTDFNGQSLGSVGTANNFGDALAYPNPATDLMSVQVLDTNNKIVTYLLVPAIQDTMFSASEVDAFFANYEGYETSRVELAANQNNTLTTPASVITLDLSILPKGYYRLFCITQDGSQHATSIYVDPAAQYPAIVDEVIGGW